MTISSTTRKAGPFVGNGVTTVFPFGFKVFSKGDVGVTLLTLAGDVENLTLDSDYSVALNPDQNAAPGGTITYPILGTPLPTGAKIVIDGALPYEQPTDITNSGGFYPSVIEDALDRAVIMIQQLAELGDRSLHFPADEGALFSGQLPAAVARASKALIFDSNGNPVVSSEAYQEPSALLSSASATSAAQIAAATPAIIGTAVGTADAHTADMIAGIQIPTFQAFAPTVLRDGVDYVSGSSTTVTLPVTAQPKVISGVFFDGVFQSPSQWSLGGDDRTLSFNGAIPQNVGETTVMYFAPGLLGTFFQSGFGAIGRAFQDKMRDQISVKDFGAVGDGVVDDTLALQRARDFVAINATRYKLIFPSGIYKYSASPNWAINDAEIEAQGQVRLRYTGTGNAVILDAGSGAQTVFNVKMGSFIVEAPATAGHGVFVRSVHHGNLGFKVRGAGAASAGMKVEFAVCTHFPDFSCSVNEEGWYLGAKPAYGVDLDKRNAGETTSYCLFTNPIIEGPPIGIQLTATLGNIFKGGTSEGCAQYGVAATAAAQSDRFYGTDFEANTITDVYVLGAFLEFHGVDTFKQIAFGTTAKGCLLVGGQHSNILLDTSSKGNTVVGAKYNRFNDGSTYLDAGVLNQSIGVQDATTGFGYLTASTTTTPGTIAAGSSFTKNISLSGVSLGAGSPIPFVAAFSQDLQGVSLTAYISASNQVTAVFANCTGASKTIPAGTLVVQGLKLGT